MREDRRVSSMGRHTVREEMNGAGGINPTKEEDSGQEEGQTCLLSFGAMVQNPQGGEMGR